MEPEKKSSGALVGLIIIIIILVVGGVYIWQSQKEMAPTQKVGSSTVTTEDSASLNTLEQDVNTTDTSVGVDANTVE